MIENIEAQKRSLECTNSSNSVLRGHTFQSGNSFRSKLRILKEMQKNYINHALNLYSDTN